MPVQLDDVAGVYKDSCHSQRARGFAAQRGVQAYRLSFASPRPSDLVRYGRWQRWMTGYPVAMQIANEQSFFHFAVFGLMTRLETMSVTCYNGKSYSFSLFIDEA